MSERTAEAATSSTPILDRLAPLPRPAAPSPWVALGVGLGLGVAVAVILKLGNPPVDSLRQWLFAHIAELFPRPLTGAKVLGMGLSAVVIAYAVVAVHELGHVIGGRLAGFRFKAIVVGPLQIDRGLRVSRYRGPGAWSRGWAGVLPAKKDNLRLRTLAMVFAGPAASFLSGLAVLLLPAVPANTGFASTVFLLASFAGGMADLIPYRTRTMASDGWRIWALLRKSAWGERWLALLRLGTDLRAGVLPESLPADDLAKATACRDDSVDTVSGHAMAYSAAFYQHRDAEAAQWLETCLRHSSAAAPTLREALMSDAAVFLARRRKRPDLAAQWLAGIPETTQLPWLRSRGEAAILEAQGDREGAVEKLGEVETQVAALPDPAQRDLALRLLERWMSELRA